MLILPDNGIPRPIHHFSRQHLAGQMSGASLPFPQQTALSEFTVPDRCIFLIVMGTGHLEDPFNSLQTLADFARDQLAPRDLSALPACNRATAFTNEHAKIARLLEKYREIQMPPAPA